MKNSFGKLRKPTITRKRAIWIAMNHNNVTRAIAERYTHSELKEVLTAVNIKAKIV